MQVMATVVLAVSAALQYLAALLALRLVQVTGRRMAWYLIFSAVLLMAVRRTLTLADPASQPDFTAEFVALIISCLMLFGIAALKPIFTELNESTQALRRERDFNATLIKSSPLFYVALDDQGRVHMANPALLEVLGYDAEEVRGKDWLEHFVPPEERQRVAQIFATLIDAEYPTINENKIMTRNGESRLVEWHGRTVKSPEGNFEFFFGMGIDVTERKRAEQALQETEARFRLVLENTPDLLYELNLASMRYEYISPASLKMMGFSPDELQAMGPRLISIRVHPNDRPYVRAQFKKLLKTEEDKTPTQNLEYRWQVKSGEYRWFSDTRTLVLGTQGLPVAMVGSARDITERMLYEQEMTRMRHYLQNVINSMPSVLVGVDVQGRVTHWNRDAEELAGIPAHEAHGEHLTQVMPLLRPLRDKIAGAVRAGETFMQERFVAENPQGESRRYDVTVFPLVADGVEAAVVRLDDVTTRVQIEEMMVQTEKMMSIGGLAAGMAHEINNPLGAILQACQNIERRTSPELAKNHEVAQELGTSMDVLAQYMERRGIYEFIRGIRSDGQRAARIVADMLTYSRRSESKQAPARVPELIDSVLTLARKDYDLKKHYDFRHIEVVREYEEELPEIRCEKTKIEQVLLNLVKNAAQAMAANPPEEGPRITVRARRENAHVRIEVEDNGPGMPPEVRERAFEPFFTTKEAGVGTGLGLSVSYFIVTKQHNGTMKVESEPGHGARFIVRLPIEPERSE